MKRFLILLFIAIPLFAQSSKVVLIYKQPDKPNKPTDLVATLNGTLINLTWTDNSNIETGYYVYRGLSEESISVYDTIAADLTAYTDSFATQGAIYWYKLKAFNNAGTSGSTVDTAEYPFANINLIAHAEITERSETDALVWNSNITATHYDFEADNTSDFSSPFFAQFNSDTSYSFDNNILENGTYYWRVRAYRSDADYYGSWSVDSFTVNISTTVDTIYNPDYVDYIYRVFDSSDVKFLPIFERQFFNNGDNTYTLQSDTLVNHANLSHESYYNNYSSLTMNSFGLYFDGVNDHVDLGRDYYSFTPGTDSYTVFGWFYVSSTNGALFSYGAGATNRQAYMYKIGGTLYANIGGGTAGVGTFATDTWTFCAMVVNTSTVTIYLNTSTASGSIGSATDPSDSYLGARTDGLNYNMGGYISCMGVIAEALTATQLDSIRIKSANFPHYDQVKITGGGGGGGDPTTSDTLYISNSGNDVTGDGSIANPFRTISKLHTLPTVDNRTILFERGDTWDEGLVINNLNNVTIDAYGSGLKPEISARNTLPGNWTNVSGNIWSLNYTNGDNVGQYHRLWLNGVEQKSIGSSSVSAGEFRSYNNTHYVYSESDPTGLVEVPYLLGNRTVLAIHGSDNLTIKNINIRGGAFGINGVDNDSLLVYNCKIYEQGEYKGISIGYYVGISGLEDSISTYMRFIKDTIDYNTTVNYGTGMAPNQAGSDGIALLYGNEDILIDSCYFKGYYHSSLLVGGETARYRLHNLTVQNSYFTNPDQSYGKPINMVGDNSLVDMTVNVTFRYNTFFDYPTRNQFCGDSIYLYYNVFDSTRLGEYDDAELQHIYFGASQQARNYWVVNNTFTRAKHYAMVLRGDYSHVWNNIIDEQRSDKVAIFNGSSNDHIELYNNLSNSDNFFYFEGDKGYTVTEANAETWGNGNIYADPQLTSYTPDAGSDAVDGGYTHTLSIYDYYGNSINGTPDIGAVEKQ